MPEHRRRIMHKFRLDEVSSVDNPAQVGAKMVIMKREDTAKLLFDEALADMQLTDEVFKLIDEQFKLNDALQHSIHSIVMDKETYPDPVSAVKESLTQFSSALVSLVSETKEDIDDEATKVEIGKRAWLQANPVNRDKTKPEPKEGPMANDDKTPTVETLAADLKEVNAKLQIAKSYGEFNDAEKVHYSKLDDAGKESFLAMSSEDRGSLIEKATEANPVVYTTKKGTDIRKSDGTLMLELAKQADDSDKIAKAERTKRRDLEIAKRIKDEIPNVPGEEKTKVALYKAVDDIVDEDTRKAIHKIFKSHNETMVLALEDRGDSTTLEIKKVEDQIEKNARQYQKDNKIKSYEQAYNEYLGTDEGQALWGKFNEEQIAAAS